MLPHLNRAIPHLTALLNYINRIVTDITPLRVIHRWIQLNNLSNLIPHLTPLSPFENRYNHSISPSSGVLNYSGCQAEFNDV